MRTTQLAVGSDRSSPPLVLTVEQAREALGGISQATIFRLMQSGQLRSFKVGRLRRVSWAAIEDYVRRQEAADDESLSVGE